MAVTIIANKQPSAVAILAATALSKGDSKMSEEKSNQENTPYRREHNGVRLFFDAPVVGSFELNGRTILTMCERNLDDAIRDMKLLVRILPPGELRQQRAAPPSPGDSTK